MPKITFIDPKGTHHDVDGTPGETLLDVARDHDIDIEGACEGAMSCSTCHVIVERKAFKNLPNPDEDEEDILDLAYGRKRTSRLACQITLSDDIDKLAVKVPTQFQ